MKTIDEIFDEIKDKPDAFYRIIELEVLWSFDYDIIRGFQMASGQEPSKMTYAEYMEGVYKTTHELHERLKEYNDRKT